MRTLTALIAAAALTFGSGLAQADTYLVNPDGTGDFSTIQAAVDAAADLDVIELGDGVFRGVGNINVDLLGKAIVIRSQSGTPEACTIDCEGSGSAVTRRAFIAQSGEDETSRIECITVVNGLAVTAGELKGGAILITQSSLTIENCVFVNNNSMWSGGAVEFHEAGGQVNDCRFIGNDAVEAGGALTASNSSQVTVNDCYFENNTASLGGGIWTLGSECAVTGCTFVNNEAWDGGGAIYRRNCINVETIEDSVFIDNRGEDGGGIAAYNSEPTIVNQCTFYGNIATTAKSYGDLGAAICGYSSVVNVSNSIISYCAAGTATYGPVTITCCDVFANAGGDGSVEGQVGLDGNFAADPLFCDPATGDLSIMAQSPCAPNAGGCGLVGAAPVGCFDTSQILPQPVISPPIACDDTVPVTFHYVPASSISGIRGYSIRVTATAQVAFDANDITVATLPPGANATHQILTFGPNDYQVDYTILGAETPGITAESDLFSVELHGVSDGEAIVTIADADLRDLANQSIPVIFDQTGSIVVDCGPPEAVTELDATPAHRSITITWQDPADPYLADLKIFRGRWDDADDLSAYPFYGRLEGSTEPTRPATVEDAVADPRWHNVAVMEPGVMAYTDTVSLRGIYYYEVFARNGAGAAGPPSAEGAAATNYILSDVVGYDGVVGIFDLTALGDAYGTSYGDPAFDPEIDYSPTSDASGSGLPLPDGFIDFEELVIMGLTFGFGVDAKAEPVVPTTARFAWVDLGEGRYSLRLLDGRGILALRLLADIGTTGNVVVTTGDLLADQDAPTFLRNAGRGLDAGLCLLGQRAGLIGTGELLVVTCAGATLDATDLTLDVRGVDGSTVSYTIDGIATGQATPDAFRLEGIYPNPFNPATTIRFALPEDSPVRLRVYGIDGRLVATLVDETRPAGVHEVVWRGVDDRGRAVASGAYFCRLEAGGYREVGKMVLMK